jgi:hypothetical protein
MKLRFVAGTQLDSRFIIWREQVTMPFTPSHVEAVVEDADGIGYVGARLRGGILRRPVGYDQGTVSNEMFLDLTASDAQNKLFYDFVLSKIGELYDWQSIFDFIVPVNRHTTDRAICSAFMTLALRHCGWLQWPVAAPAHLISPRDLLLMISAKMQVPGI